MDKNFLYDGLGELFLHRFSPEVEEDGYSYYLFIDVNKIDVTMRIDNTEGEILYKSIGLINNYSELIDRWNDRASGTYLPIINL